MQPCVLRGKKVQQVDEELTIQIDSCISCSEITEKKDTKEPKYTKLLALVFFDDIMVLFL